jgi:KEOPS complex subunit Cgi121
VKLIEGIAEIDDLQGFLDGVDDIAAKHGCTVQAFDANYVVGTDHLRRAVELADRAIQRDEAVARERGVEILLYAGGCRQIDRALEMGVAEGEVPVVVLIDRPTSSVRATLESPPGCEDDRAVEDTEGGESDPESAAADAVAELLRPTSTLGEYDPERVCSFFDITDAEREAVAGDLSDLVRERVALLDVEK